jgi:DNA-binding NtrC family response regulator
MQPLRILIVDDEEDLVSTLAERLAIRGFEVEGATSGDDALACLRRQEFSVVIVDVKMPGIGGLELTEHIRQEYPELPVILFTGQSSRDDAERAARQGALEYLLKPVDIDDLISKVSSAVADGGKDGPGS